jgi:hypothetical protein
MHGGALGVLGSGHEGQGSSLRGMSAYHEDILVQLRQEFDVGHRQLRTVLHLHSSNAHEIQGVKDTGMARSAQ